MRIISYSATEIPNASSLKFLNTTETGKVVFVCAFYSFIN